jgi:hypothetical protein
MPGQRFGQRCSTGQDGTGSGKGLTEFTPENSGFGQSLSHQPIVTAA